MSGVNRTASRRPKAWGIMLAVVGVIGVVVLLGGGAAYAVYQYDVSNAHRILPGISIAGVDVGGMTERQATAHVEAAVAPALNRTMTIRIGDEEIVRSYQDLGVDERIGRAVARALNVSDSLSRLERTYVRLTDESVDRSIKLRFRYDRSSVRAFVRNEASRIYVPPRNASVELDHGRIVFRRAHAGAALDEPAAIATIMSGLRSVEPLVSIPLERVPPKITPDTIGMTIGINLTTNTLTLYDGFHRVRTYDVGTAMQGYSTPSGTWQVIDKRENPTWVNPAPDTWGAGMPATIPGGPSSPLGTRALYLDAPGIRIHGTPDTASVGGYVSHGCIRMRMWEVEGLYPRVPIGTPVLIYGAPPWGIERNPGAAGT
jgi:lipoprotein-anchoring transpeptidase ErfK/SrfK